MISGRSALRAAALTAAVVAADQGTKALVRANVDIGSRDGVFPGIELVHVHNRGVAFGFFADGGLVLVVVAADQGSKALVRANIDFGSRDGVFPGVELVHVRNRGVAFGLFADGGLLLILVGVASVAALLAFFATHSRRPLVWLPTGLLLGGAAGNLIDRLERGYVTDFVDLPAWPAFNVADVGITFGVLTLLYVLEGPPRHAD